MQEANSFAHSSQNPGRMHACGHDGHTTMLLGAAKVLAETRDFSGTVYLIFQPAEEGGGGAREMIKDGIFDKFPMEAVFGAHNWPGMKAGQFALKTGPAFASSNEFRIVIRGKGSHAAMPHNGIDPVPAACAMVQAFQTIVSRNKRPIDPGVISVTMIHAGEATNVVPDSCEIQGTVRTFTLELLALRRLSVGAFGTLLALEPALALLIGLVVLGQVPNGLAVAGIGLVVAAGIGAERSGARTQAQPEAPGSPVPAIMGPATAV